MVDFNNYIELDANNFPINKNGNKYFTATNNGYLIIFGSHKLEVKTDFGISHMEDTRTFKDLGYAQTKVMMPLKKDSIAEIITDKIYTAYYSEGLGL